MILYYSRMQHIGGKRSKPAMIFAHDIVNFVSYIHTVHTYIGTYRFFSIGLSMWDSPILLYHSF